MIDDFKKYATKHLGMSSMVLDDVIKSQAGYLNPYILEERQLNVTQLDVFSRLMMDRIIFLGTQIDDYTANTLQAQLHLAVVSVPVLVYMTRCSSSTVMFRQSVQVWLHQWRLCFLLQDRKENVLLFLTAV